MNTENSPAFARGITIRKNVFTLPQPSSSADSSSAFGIPFMNPISSMVPKGIWPPARIKITVDSLSTIPSLVIRI